MHLIQAYGGSRIVCSNRKAISRQHVLYSVLRSSSHAHCILSGLEIYSIDMQFLHEALSFRLSPRSLSTVEQLLHPASCFRLQQDYKANCYINSRERAWGRPAPHPMRLGSTEIPNLSCGRRSMILLHRKKKHLFCHPCLHTCMPAKGNIISALCYIQEHAFYPSFVLLNFFNFKSRDVIANVELPSRK
ncbi:uncharacterized protein LOC119349616 isoform X2 [Triticum dicoccoides]|uniref:uncharacterized protein LOC119349616 isoform X2 n=1 Tax=Triticum dicoccoides TaxID=85692 RepID=UPI00189062FC|nr:uncharacterized protein LOC119349616 isoform X2 [Triticum dicoccoides]XP_037473572.1 uncharacterized protein LOC119349616 isoform X2 [Triticum dicoccoides]